MARRYEEEFPSKSQKPNAKSAKAEIHVVFIPWGVKEDPALMFISDCADVVQYSKKSWSKAKNKRGAAAIDQCFAPTDDNKLIALG
uniref:Uncharacterized protein n=1 Tax=Oryza brachyantha TaxID=4533 RepID=J3LVZ0_ORYBR